LASHAKRHVRICRCGHGQRISGQRRCAATISRAPRWWQSLDDDASHKGSGTCPGCGTSRDPAQDPRRPAEGSTIALGSASYGALQLKPGDRVLVRKMTKARLWSNVPDFLVGEVAEDPCLEAGGVCVPAADITTLKLRAGDDVLVAPMLSPGNSTGAAAATAAATDATQVEGAGRYRYRRRNGWMRTAMWMMYGRPYGHGYGYGYGHGYGRHKPSGYGRRSTSYRSVRKSYGSGRRVGGRRR